MPRLSCHASGAAPPPSPQRTIKKDNSKDIQQSNIFLNVSFAQKPANYNIYQVYDSGGSYRLKDV